MRHDSHANASPRQPGRRPLRPDLGRPSLFADFDQDSIEDVEPQRIRLLSTLESQRGVRGRPSARRLPTGRPHPWLTRSLMVLMGLGMLVMLLSFIQLLRRPPPPLPSAQASLAPTPQAMVQTGGATHPEPAEIIDLTPPSAGLQEPAQAALTPSAPATHAQAASPATSPDAGKQEAVSAKARAAAPMDPTQGTRSAKSTGSRTGNRHHDLVAPQEDVALVEAMLAHAGPRKAPPSPTALLQQCGSGSSAETAVCRARICVQHPSLPACHTP